MTRQHNRFGAAARLIPIFSVLATWPWGPGCTPTPGAASPSPTPARPNVPMGKPAAADAGGAAQLDPAETPADGAAPAARDAGLQPSEGGDGASGDAGPDLRPAPPVDELAHLSKVVPVFWITVDGGLAIPRDMKIPGRIKVIEDHDGTLEGIMARAASLESPIGIELRGQSSFEFDQKPYGIEIRDDLGKGKSMPLLGLPPESDFVLHSCYADKTCMRNALTYVVGREMGAADQRWAPRSRYVEIFVDGQYQGLYLLVERIKKDKARVNLPAPAADTTMGDVSGGYIISQEGDGGRVGEDFPSPLDLRGKMVYRYPRADVITAAQKSYLQDALKSLAQTLGSEKGLTEVVRKRIDVASFVDYELVQELSNNVDAYWKSWFFYKLPDGAGGQFFSGPLWDYDLGYGNIIFKKRYCSNTWATSELTSGPMAALVNHPEFKDALRCRWNSLRAAGGPLDLERLEQKITAFSQHIGKAKARDQMRWHNIGAWIWPNNYIGGSWADEVTYLRYWLRRRLSFLDKSLPGTCAAVPAPAAVSLIAAPPKVMESNTRMPYLGRDAPVYIPIEGPLPANLASWACPK